MSLQIKHNFVSTKTDSADSSIVRPSNWNADHIIDGTVDETLLELSDVTTLNASTERHGFLKKLPDDATLFMDGLGNWSAPAGGGGDSFWSPDMGGIIYYDGTESQAIPVSIYGSYQGFYGQVSLDLKSNGTEAGLQLTNTNGGSSFTLLSTGSGSGLGPHKFIIGSSDAYLTIDTDGNTGLGNTSPAHRLDVAGDVNYTGTLLHNGTPFTGANPQFQITIGGSEGSSPVLTVGAGRALVVPGSHDFEPATFTLHTTELIAISQTNPAVFTLADVEGIRYNQFLCICGGQGTNVPEGVTSGRVIGISGNEVTLDFDATSIVYTGGGVVGRGANNDYSVYPAADLDENEIALVCDDSFPLSVVCVNGYIRNENNYDLGLEGYGVPLGEVSVNSGDTENPVTWKDPNSWVPYVASSLRIDSTTGIVIHRAYAQTFIGATGHGFYDVENSEGNNNFWWDHTTSRLGLGKQDPAYRLDIIGDLNVSGDLRKGGQVINSFNPAAAITFTGANEFVPASTSGSSYRGVTVIPSLDEGATLSSNFYTLDLGSSIFGTVTGSVTVLNVRKPNYYGNASSATAYGLFIENGSNFPSGYVNLQSQGSGSANIFEGSVRIGSTSAPAYKLDVAGDINFTGDLLHNGSVFSGGGGSSFDLGEYHLFTNTNQFGPTEAGTTGELTAMIISPTLTGTLNGAGLRGIVVSPALGAGASSTTVSTAIQINAPDITEGTISSIYGLVVESHAAQAIHANILSKGISSVNLFGGYVSIGKEEFPDFNLDVVGDINLTGLLRKDGRLYGFALPGYPGYTYATKNLSTLLKFTATDWGAGGNDINITFLHDQDYVQTLVSMVSGHNIQMVLRTSGGVIQATASEVVTAWGFSQPALHLATVEVINSSGSSTMVDGSITLEGGQDIQYSAHGGELFFDTNGLYVGQADGSYGRIAYTEIVSIPPQPE